MPDRIENRQMDFIFRQQNRLFRICILDRMTGRAIIPSPIVLKRLLLGAIMIMIYMQILVSTQ